MSLMPSYRLIIGAFDASRCRGHDAPMRVTSFRHGARTGKVNSLRLTVYRVPRREPRFIALRRFDFAEPPMPRFMPPPPHHRPCHYAITA